MEWHSALLARCGVVKQPVGKWPVMGADGQDEGSYFNENQSWLLEFLADTRWNCFKVFSLA